MKEVHISVLDMGVWRLFTFRVFCLQDAIISLFLDLQEHQEILPELKSENKKNIHFLHMIN
jgi:hypothetical protein